jgi:hypothetical protein
MRPSLTSFVDEMLKIADEEVTVRRVGPELSTGQRALGSLALAGGSLKSGDYARKLLSTPLFHSIQAGSSELSPENLERLRELAPDAKVFDVSSLAEAMMLPKMPGEGRWSRFKRWAVEMAGVPSDVIEAAKTNNVVRAPLTHTPEIVSHELGHASLRDPARTGKVLRKVIGMRSLGIPLGLVAGSAMALQDPESVTAQAAPAVIAGGYAPMLIDEALASRRGLKAIHNLGAYSPEARAVMKKNLMKAWGTYGVAAAGAATIPLLFTQYRAHQAREERKPMSLGT